MSGTLIDSYSETNQNISDHIYNNVSERAGQAITLSADYSITSVKFYIRKYNSPTGSIYAYIYACSGTVGSTGQPTGSPLATSDAIDISTLTSSFQLIEFTFSTPYNASAGDYCIMLGFDEGSSSHNLEYGLDSSSPSHSGNYCYINAGSPNSSSSYDVPFYLYASVGWTGKVLGVSNPAKVLGLLSANLKKVIGV